MIGYSSTSEEPLCLKEEQPLARFAALTFEEELELYNLLPVPVEMEAEGDDPEARFDDTTTQDILLG